MKQFMFGLPQSYIQHVHMDSRMPTPTQWYPKTLLPSRDAEKLYGNSQFVSMI